MKYEIVFRRITDILIKLLYHNSSLNLMINGKCKQNLINLTNSIYIFFIKNIVYRKILDYVY